MIVLINSKTDWFGKDIDQEAWPVNLNLGLLGLGSELKKAGHTILVRDELSDKLSDNEISTNLIFVLSVDFASVNSAMEITQRIKELNDQSIIIWGSYSRGFFGKFVNSFPGYSLDLDDVFAECYSTHDTITLINTIKDNTIDLLLKNYNSSLGLSIRDHRGVKLIGDSNLEKEIYNPDYSLVDMEKYILRTGVEVSDNRTMKRIVPIITGDGCPYKCTFCINSSSETPYVPVNIQDILNNIDMLVEKHDIDFIWFQDDNLFANKKNYNAIFDHIEQKNYTFKWAAQGMVNYFSEDSMSSVEFKRIMKNCEWLGVGFENYNKEVREKLGKTKATNKDLMYLLGQIKELNFELAIAFIVGTPKESIKDIIETALFIFNIKRYYSKFSITYQYFRPYPNTLEFSEIMSEYSNYKLPATLQEYIEINPYGGATKKAPWISWGKHIVITFTRFSVATLYKEYISKSSKKYFWKIFSTINEIILRILNKVV